MSLVTKLFFISAIFKPNVHAYKVAIKRIKKAIIDEWWLKWVLKGSATIVILAVITSANAANG